MYIYIFIKIVFNILGILHHSTNSLACFNTFTKVQIACFDQKQKVPIYIIKIETQILSSLVFKLVIVIQVILSHLLTLNCEVLFLLLFRQVALSDPGCIKRISHFKTYSLQLGDNCVSKCSSDSFPHKKNMSPCVKNSQNHTYMFLCSPIPGTRFEKQGKLSCLTVFFSSI